MAKKRKKLTKAQAKEYAMRKRRQRQITWAVVSVVALASLAALLLVALSGGGDVEIIQVEPLRDDVETGVTEEGYPYRGAADAPVTVMEVSDYNCPVCGNFALDTFPLIDNEFVATGQVRYVVLPFGWEDSLPVVEAAACARDQDGFWEFHHLLFANQPNFSARQPPSRAMLREMAEVSGLDADALETCLDEGRHESDVLEATRFGQEELGIDATPKFFVNGVQTSLYRDEAYIDTLRGAIQEALDRE